MSPCLLIDQGGRSCVDDLLPGLSVLGDDVPVGDVVVRHEPVPWCGAVVPFEVVSDVGVTLATRSVEQRSSHQSGGGEI